PAVLARTPSHAPRSMLMFRWLNFFGRKSPRRSKQPCRKPHRYMPEFLELEKRLVPTIAVSVASSQTWMEGLGGGAAHTVATFIDADSGGALADYSSTVNWGDSTGTQSATVGTGTGGAFTVKGSHQYTSTGSFTASVTITDSGGSSTSINVPVTIAQSST